MVGLISSHIDGGCSFYQYFVQIEISTPTRSPKRPFWSLHFDCKPSPWLEGGYSKCGRNFSYFNNNHFFSHFLQNNPLFSKLDSLYSLRHFSWFWITWTL